MIEQLIAAARAGVEDRRRKVPEADLEAQLEGRQDEDDRPFSEALVRPGLSLIAEFKRRSPERRRDRLRHRRRPSRSGRMSAAGPRRCRCSPTRPISAARWRTCATPARACDLPILRKDFVVDPYQLYEAAVSGADAVLLIVRALDDETLGDLQEEARALDLDCLVEVHDAESWSGRWSRAPRSSGSTTAISTAASSTST